MKRIIPCVAMPLLAAACADVPAPGPIDHEVIAFEEACGTVVITKDPRGMSHVSAPTEALGYAGLCYAMARDRLFQMDLQRRSAQGRLAEIYGPGDGDSVLAADYFMRSQNLTAFASARFAAAAQRTKNALQACAAGVNNYIQAATAASNLPLEFQILDYQPDPWTAQDSMLAYISVGVIFDTLTWYTKLERAAVASIAGEDVSATLIKEAADLPSMFDAQGNLRPINDFLLPTGPTTPQATIIPLPPPCAPTAMRGVPPLPIHHHHSPRAGRASNSWAVDGHLTATGKPMLATDPHFPHGTPSAVWVAQLEVDGAFNIAGWMQPGFPAFVSGHNEAIAWVPTYTLYDSVDLYIETFRGDPGEEEVLIDGSWEPVSTRVETFHVKGAPDVQRTFRTTPHGPILNDGLDGLDAFGTLALKSTAGQPEYTVDGYFDLPEAGNFTQFRAAVLEQSIGWNFTFADYEGQYGHVGYQNSGLAPQRESPQNALYPVPGTGGYEWTGYAYHSELPHVYDPPSHVIATANNRIVPRDYAPQGRPVYLANYWDMAWRAQRVVTRLLNVGHPITTADMASIQLDTQTTIGLPLRDLYVAALGRTGLPAGDSSASASLAALAAWDGNASASSTGAAVYEMLTFTLLRDTVLDVVGPEEYPYFAYDVFMTNQLYGLMDVLHTPREPYFGITAGDDAGAARDAAIQAALAEADELLRGAMGTDVSAWTWGGIHELTYNHPLAEDDARFAIGTFPAQGDPETINIGGWFAQIGLLALSPQDLAAAGGVRAALAQDALSATRIVWDLSDLDNSLGVMSTGFSGDPRTGHYSDHAAPWRAGQIYQLPFTEPAINP